MPGGGNKYDTVNISTTVHPIQYSDLGMCCPDWTSGMTGIHDFHIALQSIPQMGCDGTAFSEDDFVMTDTQIGRLMALRFHPGSHSVNVENLVSGPQVPLYCICPDAGIVTSITVSHDYSPKLMIIGSDGSVSKASSSTIQVAGDDVLVTIALLGEFNDLYTNSNRFTGSEPEPGNIRLSRQQSPHADQIASFSDDYTPLAYIGPKNRPSWMEGF